MPFEKTFYRLNKLLKYRENLNLTQEELAEKAGISTRTIQRIEKGIEPKGHTLKVLAKALEIDENDLKENQIKSESINYQLIKYINLSSLPLIMIPLGSIVLPLLIIGIKKQFNPLTKQIISLQILWFILSIVLFFLIVLFTENGKIILFLSCTILFNIFIILRNAVELDKNKKLYIKLNFNII